MSGRPCIPWIWLLQTLKRDLNVTNMDKYKEQTDAILDAFPDHSLKDAENHCRNPTMDPCGPWCYVSMTSNQKEYCSVPECSAANKGNSSIIYCILFYFFYFNIQNLFFSTVSEYIQK